MLTCREGERTCLDGEWSECLGDRLTQIYDGAPQAPGIKTQALATTAADCMDKCEPYCRNLADTPEDLNPGTDFTADATGLSPKSSGLTSSNCPDVNVTPDTSTLEITAINVTDGSVTPSTKAMTAACTVGNIPIDPTWSVDQPDRSLIGVDGTLKLFSAISGDIKVTGQSLLDGDMATVTVKVNVNIVDAGVTTPNDFNNTGTTDDAGTLYPYKSTIFPLDLSPPVAQWKANGITPNGVQVALRYPSGSTMPTFWYSRIYATEPKEGPIVNAMSPAAQAAQAPAWAIPEKVWTALGRTTQNQAATLNRTADIIIQRRTAGTLYKEMVIPVTFSSEALRGTVYYMQYERRLYTPDTATLLASPQADLDITTFDPFNAAATACPVGNNTHSSRVGGSTTRAIDMSKPTATNFNPLGDGIGGCPVCHSVSAQGNMFVAGSRFLQTWPSNLPAGTGAGNGFVNSISISATGSPQFTPVGEAPNYANFSTDNGVWGSRGFAFAALTPDGALALQGPNWWGNTAGNNASPTAVSSIQTDAGQTQPMFFVPTTNTGASVDYATTAALAGATRTGNELSAAAALPTIDGATLAVNDSVLVKDQTNKVDNGIYTVTDLGGYTCAGTNLTSAVVTSVASSIENAGNAAAGATDNNTATRWGSLFSDPQWIYLDLGSTKAFSCVSISWQNASAKAYDIQTSNVASTMDSAWTTLATKSNMPSGARTDVVANLTGNARYVRIRGTQRTTTFGYSIIEMDVYTSQTALPYKLTRRSDADSDPGVASTTNSGEILGNWEVRVTRGSANYAKVFRLNSSAKPVINTTQMTFVDTGASALPVMSMATISPNGQKIAYVNGDADPVGTDNTAWRKGLTTINFDQTTRTWSGKKRIVSNYNSTTSMPADGGIPIKWPFFEHDSSSIVFVQTSADEYCRSGGSTADNPGKACYGDGFGFANAAPTQRGYWPGRLWSADTSAMTPSKVELATLNNAEQTADAGKAYQPTVLPFVSGGYRWVIFTSPRAYGNQLNQVTAGGLATNFTCASTLLWVAALDNAASATMDRSHPAFLLPGQNMEAITNEYHHINERGYLVPTPCKTTGIGCTTSDECCSPNQCRVESVAMSGVPSKVCKSATACSNEGGACLSNADCCGSAPCVAQKCQNVPAFTEATYTRTYVAECESGFKPLWGAFSYHMTARNGSHIEFSAKTATTDAGLATATSVALKDASADNYNLPAESVDVGAKLTAQMVSPYLSYLKVSMRFLPSSGGAVAPILHDWEQRFSCLPAE